MTNRLIVVALAAAGLLAAQDPPSRAGRISYINGAVSFQPAGVDQWAGATVNRPLTVGDQLFADNGARAEVRVPGSAFRLGDRTAFQFENLDDRNVQVRLSEGTLDLRVRDLYGNIEIDAPNLALTVSRPGEYRIDTNPDNLQSYVTVRDGEGQVTSSGGTFPIHSGQQAVVNGQDQSAQYQIFPAPGPDGFDNWVLSRNRRDDRYAQSRYVSHQMVGYEDLGEYGTWRSTPDYGQVWVPNNVSAGWAPYQDGHWAWVDPWGWTWVDDQPWGFAPFHYGRWAHVNGYWGWCPGPVAVAPIYAPALVAWVGFGGGFGVSVGFGAGPSVGWFPLGPRDVYIPAYTASATYVNRVNVTNTTIINTTNVTNVYRNYQRTGAVPVNTYMNRSVPGAVMAAPQTALTSAQPVRQIAKRIQPNQLSSVNGAVAAPRVVPQVASVMGRSAAGNVPRPSAAVLNRPVVARTAPPAVPSFQQRQAILAKNPGRPIPAAQLQQIARTAPASAVARPPVRVVTQARPITPQAAAARPPANTPPSPQPRPATPPATQAQQQRPGVPPARPAAAPPAQAQQQRPGAAPQRPFEPPAAQPGNRSAQQRPATPPATQPQRPGVPQTRPGTPSPTQAQQQRPSAAPERSLPPAAQPGNRSAQQRPATPPARQEQRPAAPQQRTMTPPAVQAQRPNTPAQRPASPPAAQQAQRSAPQQQRAPAQTRPSQPPVSATARPPARQPAHAAPPPNAQPRAQQAPARPQQQQQRPAPRQAAPQPPQQPRTQQPHAAPQTRPAAPPHQPERKEPPH